MKRSIGFLVSISFACFILIAPLHSFASTNINDSETTLVQKKEINNYLRVFTGLPTPPSTYKYDLGGWKGTLYLDHWQSTGDEIIAYYSGTVYCTGTCVVGNNADDN